MSPRRLWVLLRGLPATSRTKRAVDPEAAVYADWGVEAYLLADLYDAVRAGYAQNPRPHPRADDVVKAERSRKQRHAFFDAKTRGGS